MSVKTALRGALDLDKAPPTRRELVLWGLVLACLAFEPSVAKVAAGVAFGGLGAVLAWLWR